MFGIDFSEFVVIGIVALIVLGPERLPKVARTAGHLFGRLQRYVADVKDQVNREMQSEELSGLKTQFEEVRDAARGMHQTVREELTQTQTEVRSALELSPQTSLQFADELPTATVPVAEPSPQLELPLAAPPAASTPPTTPTPAPLVAALDANPPADRAK